MAFVSFNAKERDQDLSRNIIEAHGYIERYLEGFDKPTFLIDRKTQDAVAMRLQQILECAGKISTEAKANLKLDWVSLIAMRNKISHSYVDIDAEIVWDVVNDFDQFKNLIRWARELA